jgi:branched-chain amino acid transport system substrate-binding protein
MRSSVIRTSCGGPDSEKLTRTDGANLAGRTVTSERTIEEFIIDHARLFSIVTMASSAYEQSTRRSRRGFLKTAAVTAAGTVLAGCAGGGGGQSNSSGGASTGGTTDGPVNIGALLPLSGPQALAGQEVKRGAEMAREHLDGQILGEELNLIVRDTGSEPQTALEGARALVEKRDVDAIIGPTLSSSGTTIIPYIREKAQVPLLPTQVSATSAREGENCTAYSFFIWPSNRHQVPVGVDFVNDLAGQIDREIDPGKMHFFSPDYALGQNNLELLKKELESRGGEVVGSTLAPLGTQDLSSYISEISQSEADVVTGVLTPGLASRLINQSEDFGLVEEKVLMFNSGKPVDQVTHANVGDAANGWYGTPFYNPTSDRDINQTFQDIYPSDSKLLPNSVAGSGFETVRALSIAMEDAGSTNADDVTDSLAGLSWESVFGSTTFRESDGQTELDFVGATRRDGQFEVLETYNGILPPNKC